MTDPDNTIPTLNTPPAQNAARLYLVTRGANFMPDGDTRGSSTNTPEYPTGATVLPPQDLPGRGRSGGYRRFLSAPATYVLLAVNIGVFLAMVHAGVSAKMPSERALLHFGANNVLLVLQYHQWWRVVTAMFVHVGLFHLATNMWCLWNLGLLGEPLLGFLGVISVYLLTGAAGNLLSVAYNVIFQNYGEVGAGASGAVFGIAGILIVLLSNKRLSDTRNGRPGVPPEELRQLRKSVINFAGINLLIGLGSVFMPIVRIDNMAHLGGFLSGLAIGVPLLSAMTSGRKRYLNRQRLTFAGSVLALVLFGELISKLRG